MISVLKRFTRGSLWATLSRHGFSLVLLFSLALRLFDLGSESLWYDEAFTSLIADLPFHNALAAVAGDVHPPLWYMIEWLVAHVFGNGKIAMRSPALLFGMLSLYQVYVYCSVINKKRLGTLAALIMGIMPSMLYYATEARMYALLAWLVLFVMTSIELRQWLRVSIGLVLLMYVHNLAFIYVAVLGSWFLLKAKKKAFRYAPLALAYLPWLVVAYRQAQSMQSGFWIVPHGIGQIFYSLTYVTLFMRLPEWLQLHASGFVIAITVIALWINRQEKRMTPVIAMIVIPPILLQIVSTLWLPVALERAILPSAACLAILLSSTLYKLLPRDLLKLAVVGVPILACSWVGYYSNDRYDFEGIARQVETVTVDHDAIYHTSIPSIIFLASYMPTRDHYALPDVGDLSQSLTDETKLAMGIKQREVDLSVLHDMGYERVLLLRTLTPGSNPDRQADVDRILATYPIVDSWSLIDTIFGKLDAVMIKLPYLETIDPQWIAARKGYP